MCQQRSSNIKLTDMEAATTAPPSVNEIFTGVSAAPDTTSQTESNEVHSNSDSEIIDSETGMNIFLEN